MKHFYILHKCKVGKLQVAEYDWTHPQTCHTYMNCHLKYLYRLIPFSDDWIVLTGKKMKLEGREKKINYTKGFLQSPNHQIHSFHIRDCSIYGLLFIVFPQQNCIHITDK